MTSKVLILLLAVCALVTTVAGHQYTGYDFGVSISRLNRRRTLTENTLVFNQLASVTEDDDVNKALRKEIRDLEQNEDQWTLYILGLSMMQYTNQSDEISWYQVTGIHGVPFQTWGGVEPTSGNNNTGYCTHISVLFPTWHRAYLSVYENILYQVINEIVKLWDDEDDRQRYQNALRLLRLPYWDWASNRTVNGTLFPQSIGGSEYMEIKGPNGVQTIRNPLYSYEFKPLDQLDFLDLTPWDIWNETVRAPTSNQSSADSNNSVVEAMLDQNLPSIQQRLINLFSRYDNYTEFSNSAWIPNTSNASYDSLESLHDNIHSIAGGNSGHMAFIPFSAFDPVFFLHHVNVDRLFAMWQALNPDSWVTPYPALMNSYTTSVGQIQDVNTDLTPFYASTDGTFYNSDMVRNEKKLGYSYAEVENITLGAPANKTLQSQVVRVINQLYGSSSVYRLVKELDGEEGSGPSTKSLAASLVTDGRYREWVANIHVGKQALDGPFVIHLFLADAPDDSATSPHAANIVGTINMFTAPDMPGMSMMNPNISGTVPLTAALAKKVVSGALLNLGTDEVEPYLRQNLKASVVTAQGTVVNLSTVPSLGIHVISSSVVAPESDDELPVWDSTVTSHFDLV